jgi:hypothetical protein
MPLLVNSVPNLAQGVSQQPDNLRYPGQCDEQINAWATVVEGLVKRPPTTYTKKIGDSDPGANLFTHFVKRDETNKYCVTVSLGGVGVINLEDGTNYPVTVTSIASSYLSLGTSITNPLADLRALTVADYTFLVNKRKTVQKDTQSYTSVPDKEALVVVKLGDYEKGYSVYIDDIIVPLASTITEAHHDYQTSNLSPDRPATYISGPSTGTHAGKHADTEYIAKHLTDCISEVYATSRIGITDITFSDGGSGWLQGLRVVRHGFASYNTSFLKEKVEFYVTQTVGGVRNTSAKGVCEVQNGEITDFTIINSGNNYDLDTTTYPLSVEILQLAYSNGWRPITLLSGDPLVKPATITPTVSTIEPFIVEREGSVIRIRKTKNVSNGGNNYLLKVEHKANSDNEPGVGQSWQFYWEETTSSAGTSAWVDGTEYNKGTDFDVRTTDGLANEGLEAVYKEVSSITDLPKQCFNNFTVKVKGDADIDQDDYFVRFTTDNKIKFGKGSWIETVGWNQDESETSLIEGVQTKVDTTTMPVTLVPVFTGNEVTSFKLQTPQEDEEVEVPNEIGWRTRQAGNDNTNPFPSFVGNKINDVFFFKNRLGFLTDSNVIFSEADEYFNFFRTTTQQLLDSAPIDVGLSHTKVAVLQHAVPFQEKLMLFSKQSQFVLRGAEILSPKTVAISPVTEYDISDSVQPVALGNYIYFTFRRNDFEGMYEYFVDNNTETFHSEEITSQIPKYITKQVEKIAGSQAENTIVVGTSGDRNTLFVYKYFWSNKEKIQSAWMKFTFGREVRGFDFIDSNLHLFTKDDDGLHLEKLTLEDGLTDEGLDYTLYLDSKVDGSELTVSSYNPVTKVTRVSGIPYDVSINTDATIYTKLGNERAFTVVDSSTVDVSGPLASYADYGGDYVTYNSEYYYCIKTHTSTGTFESNNWTKALHPPSGVIDAWQASTSYVQGTIYKCDTNHTSTAADTPDTSAKWSTTSEVSRAAEWGANVFYNNDTYFVLGLSYNMLYRFSDQTLKQPTERGGRSASDYAFQTIRNGSLNYAETGHFTVEVTPKFRDKYTYAFNPDIVGANLTLNTFTPQDGHFRFPVQCQPNEAKIEVVTDSALPVKLLAAEFESMMIPRSRRYGA